MAHKHKHRHSHHLAELGGTTRKHKVAKNTQSEAEGGIKRDEKLEHAREMAELASKAREFSDRGTDAFSRSQDISGNGSKSIKPDETDEINNQFGEGTDQADRDEHILTNPIVRWMHLSPRTVRVAGRLYGHATRATTIVTQLWLATKAWKAWRARAVAQALKTGATNAAESTAIEGAAAGAESAVGGTAAVEMAGLAGGEIGGAAVGLGAIGTAGAIVVPAAIATGVTAAGIAIAAGGYTALRKTGVLGKDAPGVVEAAHNSIWRLRSFFAMGGTEGYDKTVRGDAAENLSAQILARGTAKARRLETQRKAHAHLMAANHAHLGSKTHQLSHKRHSNPRIVVQARKPTYSRNSIGEIKVVFSPLIIRVSDGLRKQAAAI